MYLSDTIIIESSDVSFAKKQFRGFIEEEMVVGLVILGDDALSEGVIEFANNLAKATFHGIDRKVLWIKNVPAVEDLLKDLFKNNPDFAVNNLSDVLAISLSNVNDIIKDVVFRKEYDKPNLFYARLNKAFIKAIEP